MYINITWDYLHNSQTQSQVLPTKPKFNLNWVVLYTQPKLLDAYSLKKDIWKTNPLP